MRQLGTKFWTWSAATVLAAVTGSGLGCSTNAETESIGLGADTALPPRRGTVVVDGCVLDTWTRSTLSSPQTKRVVSEVIMLCLVPREDGTVGPRDPSARAALSTLFAELKSEGYRMHLGVSFTDESGQRYDGAQTRAWIAEPGWRVRFAGSLALVIEPADGVEIDLQQLPNDSRPFVRDLIAEAARVVRPARQLNVFIPPSVSNPSDLPGGDAFSRRELAPNVDRMRVMTLDYSEASPGPTIDSGWAVDAVKLAKADFPNVDISVPLYGTDWGPRGRRPITYNEARAVSADTGSSVQRGPSGAPFIQYTAFGNEPHELWFDDAASTARVLGAWTLDVLPQDVGVLFYGLGAEDPHLFERLAEKMP